MTAPKPLSKAQRALADLVHAVEVDHKLRGIDPRNVLDAHTFVAMAMRDADRILGREAITQKEKR